MDAVEYTPLEPGLAPDSDIPQEVLQAARELGAAINQHPVVRRFREAEQAVQQNEALRLLKEEMQAAYREHLRLQTVGGTGRSEPLKRYYKQYQQWSANPFVIELEQCRKEVQEFYRQLGAAFSSHLTVEFTELALKIDR
jgi:cell fate (sporulation/competence/biofilm development) regulator YmcA (YheA/YmcA/DUF963 family)